MSERQDQSGQVVRRHGLVTPEPTVEPPEVKNVHPTEVQTAPKKKKKASKELAPPNALKLLPPSSSAGDSTQENGSESPLFVPEPSGAAERASVVSNSPPADSHSTKQKETIENIIKQDPDNFYGILGFRGIVLKDEATKAYRQRALLIHPDKGCDHPQAKEAWNRLQRAKDTLQLVEIPVGESFRRSASLSEGDSSDESDDDNPGIMDGNGKRVDNDGNTITDRSNIDSQNELILKSIEAAEPDAAVPNTTMSDALILSTAVTNTVVPGSNTPMTDVPMPSAAVPSTGVPNTAMPGSDTPMTDIPMPSAAVPSNAVPNTAMPTTVPNTAVSGAAVSDTPMSDVSMPSAAVPETGEEFEWPWATGVTAYGARILAYRKQGRGHRAIVERKPGNRVFAIQSGSDCGLLEFNQYLSEEHRLELTPPTVTWSIEEHRDKFISLEYFAVSEYNKHNTISKSGAARKDPESYCFVNWKELGLRAITTSMLRRVISTASADGAITKICADNDAQPPWKKQPQTIVVKMSKGKQPQDIDVKSESAADTGFEDRLKVLEGKVEQNAIVVKPELNNRLDALEKQVEKKHKEIDDKFSMLKEEMNKTLGDTITKTIEASTAQMTQMMAQMMTQMKALTAANG